MDNDTLKQEATKWHDWFQKGQKHWSVAHHATVFGSIGFLLATFHFLFSAGTTSNGIPTSIPSISGWAPSLAFACLGFWFVLLGLAARRPPTA